MTTNVSETLARPVARPQHLGNWQLAQLIDEGNFTQVYRARPRGNGSAGAGADYVVKLLKAEYRDMPEVLGYLSTEAFLGRTISHNNLVSVLASHVDAPPFYLVQPYIDAVTLKQSTGGEKNASGEKNERALPTLLWVTRQTAQALAALHERHWIHGDVNPTNILVSSQGHATLIDLGLARRYDAPPHQAVAGTLGYVAPEILVATQSAGAAGDIYSLGVTLFELLTGRLPFEQTDPAELALAHLRQQPPCVRTYRPQLPSRVSWLVRRMLAKEPLRRPNTDELVELLVDLEIELFAER